MGQKFGIVTICGVTNAGKSTFVNMVVGDKVSIVTPKVQTTRNVIRGVYNRDETQLVFVDTPGIFKRTGSVNLEKSMTKTAWKAIRDADVAMILIDGKRGVCKDTGHIIADFKGRDKKLIAVINKIDAISDEEKIEIGLELEKFEHISDIFYISSVKRTGVDRFLEFLMSHAKDGEWLYDADILTNTSVRVSVSEVIREKIFLNCRDELPYSIAVMVDEFDETDDMVNIGATIIVKRESQKKIVIGSHAEMLKKIRTESIVEMREHGMVEAEKRINMTLFVKVDENWQNSAQYYQYMGMECDL